MSSFKKTEQNLLDDFEASLSKIPVANQVVKEEEKTKYQYVEQSFDPQIPDTDFRPTPTKELDQKISGQMKDFSALLDSLSSLEEKKKSLWKQIYENAVTDRKNAYILFGDLYKDVHNNPNEHAIHGPNLAKYLERMEKSNQQLIKLAEMIDDVVENEEDIIADEETIYERIQKGKK